MNSVSKIALAAHNNAEWCDAVTRSWGGHGRFEAGLWINPGEAPPFYPNAVTLAPTEGVPPAIAAARGDFAVKDSFAVLDLKPLGFAPLFEATWIWRDPQPAPTSNAATWRILRDTGSLARWQAAWRADDEGGPSPFHPTLLYKRGHAFIAGEIEGRIVAGGVASRSKAVVGISNLFGPAELAPGCLAAVQAFAPDLPIVGYEAGAALGRMKSLGFQALRLLRVWARSSD
jgi:hypothetical protein